MQNHAVEAKPQARDLWTTDSTTDIQEDFADLVSDVSACVTRYCQKRPGVVAGVIFSVGFILGWKLGR